MSLISTLLYPPSRRPTPQLKPGQCLGNMRHVTFEYDKPDVSLDHDPQHGQQIMRGKLLVCQKNTARIIGILSRYGPSSRAMIAAMADIKDATVMDRLRKLIKEGRVAYTDSKGPRGAPLRVYFLANNEQHTGETA